MLRREETLRRRRIGRERARAQHMRISSEDRILGCLLGGAIGDALGAPVEFWSRAQIEAQCGAGGVREYLPVAFDGPPQKGLITDDTQMTLFTCEGLMRAHMRGMTRGMCHPAGVVHYAYQRWLETQERDAPRRFAPDEYGGDHRGWLVEETWLYSRRAPGKTCLTALEALRGGGFESSADNDSKGCGGVMRSAPFGLYRELFDAVETAVECAGITHGHRTGQLASGAFARMIQVVFDGRSLESAVDAALEWLEDQGGKDETVQALQAAMRAAQSGPPTWQTVESLGGGWIAEEALAIGVYCALVHQGAEELREALSLAVSHTGDSDSTGSICGNLLGTLHGVDALPQDLLAELEGRETIEQVGRDMAVFVETPERVIAEDRVDRHGGRVWWDRYPGC